MKTVKVYDETHSDLTEIKNRYGLSRIVAMREAVKLAKHVWAESGEVTIRVSPQDPERRKGAA